MGRVDVRRKYVESVGLGSVMSTMSPRGHLKRQLNYQKMGMIPGSSMVEHSAVNRRVASSNLARGANFSIT